MNYKKPYRWIFVSLFFAILPVSQSLSVELSAPQLIIKNVSDQLKVRMQDETFVTNFTQITEFVDRVVFPVVNFNRISQLVLGPLWKQASSEQKTRFQKAFKTLLVRTYSRAFVEFDEWSIRYLPLRKKAEGAKKLSVRTQVLQPGVKPIGIDYTMGRFGRQWQIYDIKIEGISLVSNYRSSFKNEVKRSGSLDSVIAKLEKKNETSLVAKSQ